MSDDLHVKDLLETPPDGWRCPDMQTGKLHRGETYNELVKTITNYRKDNGLDPGDPEAEIHAFLCSKYPQRCGRPPVPRLPGVGQFGVDDVRSFLGFFSNVIQRKKLPEQELVDQRAATCVSCPYNTTLPFCHGCLSMAGEIAAAVGKLRSKYDLALRECGACGCALRAKVHTPVESLDSTDHPYPDWCWVKTETEPLA